MPMPHTRHPSLIALLLACGAAGLGHSSSAAAGVAELLLKKGIINQEEYLQLKEEAKAEAAATIHTVSVPSATPTAVAPVAEPAPAPAPAVPAVGFAKGFSVTGIDGSYTAQFGTLMQLDAAGYSDDGLDNNSGTEMRRGRLYMQGTVLKDWQYKFEMEVFGSTGTEVTDAFVRYNGFQPLASGKPLAITVGHFKIPFSLEQMMSDKDLSLMERSLPNAFLKSRAPGAMVSTSGEHWTAAAMLFGEQLTSNTTNQQDEGGGASARITWAPRIEDGAALHVGLSSQYQEPTQRVGGPTLRYSSRPESRMTSLTLVDTAAIGGHIDNIALYGAEAAATLGSLTLSSEYTRSSVARKSGGDLDFDGWYAQAAWMMTGEMRGYHPDNGVFKGIQPYHPIGTGGTGAWELAVRYSELDLTDGAISGGNERNSTVGLGWYANNFVRVSANWVHVFDIDGGKYDGESLDALQMRLQFAY